MYNLLPLKISCSYLVFLKWLQDHMLPCPFKYFTGVDCPGCGFQRSVLALLQGYFHKSIQLYPSGIPLLIFFIYGIADGYFKLDIAEKIAYDKKLIVKELAKYSIQSILSTPQELTTNAINRYLELKAKQKI